MNENKKNSKSEEEIKERALRDNTAQNIFNDLKEIENERENFEKRWIWELLQNSLDAAFKEKTITVKFIKKNNSLIFTHNGRPFESEEVVHLIYQGTTKEDEEEDVGRFGSGFLATHLISKKVNVVGYREDRYKFKFTLDREGNTSRIIMDNNEKAWLEYKESLIKSNEIPEFPVEFEYTINNESENIVYAGINELKKIAPFILTFNPKIKSINIIYDNDDIKFKLADEDNEDEGNENKDNLKEIIEYRNNEFYFCHKIWVMKNNDVEIGIKIHKNNDSFLFIDQSDFPKLFLAFPLSDTIDMPIPVIINSRKFLPTEKRDGIYLGKEDKDDILTNKELIEKAYDLLKEMISSQSGFKWDNLDILLNIRSPPEKHWLDNDWYKGLLQGFIHDIMELPVLKTGIDKFIIFKEGFIPVQATPLFILNLWDICNDISDYKEKIPEKEIALNWYNILQGWKSLEIATLNYEISIQSIVDKIEECRNIKEFQDFLDGDKNAFEELNNIYSLINKTENVVLYKNNILPDQNGNLNCHTALFSDPGIDDTLKDISKNLGEDTRGQLIHLDVQENVKAQLTVKKEDEIFSIILKNIKTENWEDANYVDANLNLFKWLLDNNKIEFFKAYPILSMKENTSVILGNDKPLAPVDIWDDRVKQFKNFFPKDKVISSKYYDFLLINKENIQNNKDNSNNESKNTSDDNNENVSTDIEDNNLDIDTLKKEDFKEWITLENNNLIIFEPLYYFNKKITQDEIQNLILNDDEFNDDIEHEPIEEIQLSNIAFLKTDNGVIDTIRQSKEKNRKFVFFLSDYVIEKDGYWENPIEFKCKCELNHRIYPAYWIEAIKRRKWISVTGTRNERVNAKNLSKVIRGHNDLLQKLSNYKPHKLLNILDIQISELLMNIAAKNPRVRFELDRAVGSLYGTFMDQPGQLSKIAEIAKSDPGMFIEELEERIKTKKRIGKNKHTGLLIENMLINALKGEGLTVNRTGRGSDCVVENDYTVDGEEILFEVLAKDRKICYIEIKATSQNAIRMTIAQGREAYSNPNKYSLCVVTYSDVDITEDEIKNNAKFVTNIGVLIKDKVQIVNDYKMHQEDVLDKGDIEIEISEDPPKYKINKKVWTRGIDFGQFLDYIRALKNEN